MITTKYRAGRIAPCEQCHFLRLEALVNKGQIFQTLYEILHEISYENFMLEHLADKLGFLLKKKVAFIDPISWNRE